MVFLARDSVRRLLDNVFYIASDNLRFRRFDNGRLVFRLGGILVFAAFVVSVRNGSENTRLWCWAIYSLDTTIDSNDFSI